MNTLHFKTYSLFNLTLILAFTACGAETFTLSGVAGESLSQKCSTGDKIEIRCSVDSLVTITGGALSNKQFCSPNQNINIECSESLTIQAVFSNEVEPFSLQFNPALNGNFAECSTSGSLGLNNTTARIKDLRMYLSNIYFETAAGNKIPAIINENIFQTNVGSDNLTLLDFENGTGLCTTNHEPTHRIIQGYIEKNNYAHIGFDIGVPFALNHIDIASAPSPLAFSGMHWSWQGGYKFMRFDLEVDDPSSPGGVRGWNNHIGSTGCVSTSAVQAPENTCGQPNLIPIRLTAPTTNPLQRELSININLDQMLNGVDLNNDTPAPAGGSITPGCMMSPQDGAECDQLLNNFGIDRATGLCATDCLSQSIFTF